VGDWGRFNLNTVILLINNELHEIDVISNIYPVQRNVRDQFLDSQFFKFIVIFLQETAIGTYRIYYSSHLNIF